MAHQSAVACGWQITPPVGFGTAASHSRLPVLICRKTNRAAPVSLRHRRADTAGQKRTVQPWAGGRVGWTAPDHEPARYRDSDIFAAQAGEFATTRRQTGTVRASPINNP